LCWYDVSKVPRKRKIGRTEHYRWMGCKTTMTKQEVDTAKEREGTGKGPEKEDTDT